MKNRKIGKVNNAHAPGGFILVEMLTPEEAMGTQLELASAKNVPNQGYVLDIGPAIEEKQYGIKVGDRVLLQGTFVPVPRFKEGRELAIVDPHTIKCVLEEEK